MPGTLSVLVPLHVEQVKVFTPVLEQEAGAVVICPASHLWPRAEIDFVSTAEQVEQVRDCEPFTSQVAGFVVSHVP